MIQQPEAQQMITDSVQICDSVPTMSQEESQQQEEAMRDMSRQVRDTSHQVRESSVPDSDDDMFSATPSQRK